MINQFFLALAPIAIGGFLLLLAIACFGLLYTIVVLVTYHLWRKKTLREIWG